jgi:hypothetical protein
VYGKDIHGNVSAFSIQFDIRIPFDLKQQSSASAFTSLVRQNVEVNAAEYSVNNEVYPAGVTTLGSLMSPAAPDNTKDKLPCNC